MNRYIEENKNKLNLTNEKGQLIFYHESFDPKDIFTCGQCFNFFEEEDGSFTAVFFGKNYKSQKRRRKNNNR